MVQLNVGDGTHLPSIQSELCCSETCVLSGTTQSDSNTDLKTKSPLLI